MIPVLQRHCVHACVSRPPKTEPNSKPALIAPSSTTITTRWKWQWQWQWQWRWTCTGIIVLCILSVTTLAIILRTKSFALLIQTSKSTSGSVSGRNYATPSRLHGRRRRRLQPQICSHQLLNPPPLQATRRRSRQEQPLDGSLDSMTALFQAGIRCFDVDVVTLQDGALLATHPKRLEQALLLSTTLSHNNNSSRTSNGQHDEKNNKAQHHAPASHYFTSLSSIRRAGVTSEAFPLLTEILQRYAELIHRRHDGGTGQSPLMPFYGSDDEEENKPENEDGDSSQKDKEYASLFILQGPLLTLDLKGPFLGQGHLDYILDQVYSLGLEQNVALAVAALEPGEIGPGIDILKVLGSGSGRDGDRDRDELRPAATQNQQKNTNKKYSKKRKPIPLGLVLRDGVSLDWNLVRVQRLLKEYSHSIRLLVPSVHFDPQWFEQLHELQFQQLQLQLQQQQQQLQQQQQQQHRILPMMVWTVANSQDLELASTRQGVSAVVANRPMDYYNSYP